MAPRRPEGNKKGRTLIQRGLKQAGHRFPSTALHESRAWKMRETGMKWIGLFRICERSVEACESCEDATEEMNTSDRDKAIR